MMDAVPLIADGWTSPPPAMQPSPVRSPASGP